MKTIVLIGGGCKKTDADLWMKSGLPILTSWAGINLVDNQHPLYFGRPGIYGQRCANRILFEAEEVIALGCRLSLWTVGYNWKPKKLIWNEIDPQETARYPEAEKTYGFGYAPTMNIDTADWLEECFTWNVPWVEGEPEYQGYINPYHFINELSKLFKDDQIIATDTGTPYVVAHQILRLKKDQRLLASNGLSEMGAGLPGAIGACIGAGREVLMMSGDGGFMMNIQELATIQAKRFPVKMIVFNNGGYNMIRRTQENFGMAPVGVCEPDIVMPSFRRVALGFDLPAVECRTWEDFNRVVPWFMQHQGAALLEVFTSPNQPLLKLNPSKNPDGTINSPEFWDLTFKE